MEQTINQHEWEKKSIKSVIQICKKCGSKRKLSNGAFMYNGLGNHWTRLQVPCIPSDIQSVMKNLSIPLRINKTPAKEVGNNDADKGNT